MKRARIIAVIALYLCLNAIFLGADEYIIQWADTLDNGDWDGASAVVVDNANDIIVTGSSFIGGNNDYFTVKYDSSGSIVWQDTIDNGGEDYAEDVAVDNSGNIIVTGYSMVGGNYDYFTVKYDPYGTVIWQETLDNEGLYDIARGVAVDDSNNIIVTGYCDIDDACVYYTVKYDSNGAILWADSLENGAFNSAFDVAIDGDNNIAITGYTTIGVNNDYFTVKYDPGGMVLWVDTVNVHQYDQSYGIAIDHADNIIVSGCSGEAMSDYDFYTVKYNSSGTVLWQDAFDYENSDDVAYGVAVDDSNNIFVTGYALELGGDYDYFTLKYDSTSAVLWYDKLNNGDNDIAFSVVIDGRNNIIVTGRSSIGGDFDYFTVRYAPVQGIEKEEKSAKLVGEIRCTVYPNPFREKTEIDFQFPMDIENEPTPPGPESVEIYNSLGRRVRKFEIRPGGASDCITWRGTGDSGERLPGGVYFLVCEIEGHKAMKKLLLLR